MKKLLFTLLMGLFLSPLQTFADHYDYDELMTDPPPPARSQVPFQIIFNLDYDTGDLTITPVINITDMTITLTGYGVTYINTTISLNALQSYTNCLNFLSVGTYYLTVSTANGVIKQYKIKVEPD